VNLYITVRACVSESILKQENLRSRKFPCGEQFANDLAVQGVISSEPEIVAVEDAGSPFKENKREAILLAQVTENSLDVRLRFFVRVRIGDMKDQGRSALE
jgi:hypothetical protein